MNDDENPKLDPHFKEAFEESMLELMQKLIDDDKVGNALNRFLELNENPHLSGPEMIAASATILAAVVKTCPSPILAIKLFVILLSEEMPEITVLVKQQDVTVDPRPSR